MIQRLFGFSIQHKIPLWGALLIIVSTVSVSGTLMFRAYQDLNSALTASAGSLGSTMVQTLITPILHDDVWRSFEIVRAPFKTLDTENPVQPEMVIVIAPDNTVFVSSHPNQLPMLSELSLLGQDFGYLTNTALPFRSNSIEIIETSDSNRIFVTVPILESDTRLGTLALVYSRSALNDRFISSLQSGALLGFLVLAILLPINWYWGYRMAIPLVRLAERMDRIPHQLPRGKEPNLYEYDDELGHLFNAYDRMVTTIREKMLLERKYLNAERLAAVGRLTAGIAHEINNPLAGMLTAVDTLKSRGSLDQRSQRTVGLLERGLIQVQNTVSALLVEVRQDNRNFSREDIDDVKTLVQYKADKKNLDIKMDITMPPTVPVPSGPIRQILINLLNNAIQEVDSKDWVHCIMRSESRQFYIEVANSGRPIPSEQLDNLFEPFVSYREGGHGLGLWVIYQLVDQLGGHIEIESGNEKVSFQVFIPLTNPETDQT